MVFKLPQDTSLRYFQHPKKSDSLYEKEGKSHMHQSMEYHKLKLLACIHSSGVIHRIHAVCIL